MHNHISPSSWRKTHPAPAPAPAPPPPHYYDDDQYDIEAGDQGWLQLRLGLNTSSTTSTTTTTCCCKTTGISIKASAGHHHQQQSHHHDHQMHSSSTNQNAAAAATTRPRYHSSTTFTPKSGLWFTLHSSLNRELGEEGEALPQIPKAYIRVKEENVTILMVKKYLVKKLGLSDESEIDIWCMGQKLKHTETLKQVRDGVWLPRLVEFSVNSANLLASSSSSSSSFGLDQQQQQADFFRSCFSNHLMSLHYGRVVHYIFN